MYLDSVITMQPISEDKMCLDVWGVIEYYI